MGLPLFSVAALRALELDAARDLPRATLMKRAGAAAARQIASCLGSTPRTIAVVCGPGNNGGDGYACALELADRGHAVECFAPSPPSTEDAIATATAWRARGGTVGSALPVSRSFDAVVDALFGIGLARPLGGPLRAAADWIRAQHTALRVALDVPSGLDADRGTWVGAVPGVHADLTITFLGAKPGLFTAAGCDAAGEVRVESLGVELPASRIMRTDAADFAPVCARRARDTHKGSFGNVGIVGGAAGMVGAPLLAARAALRLGAGRVFVECIGAPTMQLDPVQPELMFRSLRTLDRLDAVVAGCGLGAGGDAHATLQWALATPCAAVFDADALNLLAGDTTLRTRLRERSPASILTPHPLEAARLLGVDAGAVQNDRLDGARRLAEDLRATIVLKGAGTIVALSDGACYVNPTGGPALATPGSGDVLAGMIGALLVQGFSPTDATLAAVWLHGAAADQAGGDVGLVAGEIAARAAACLVQLRGERSA